MAMVVVDAVVDETLCGTCYGSLDRVSTRLWVLYHPFLLQFSNKPDFEADEEMKEE